MDHSIFSVREINLLSIILNHLSFFHKHIIGIINRICFAFQALRFFGVPKCYPGFVFIGIINCQPCTEIISNRGGCTLHRRDHGFQDVAASFEMKFVCGEFRHISKISNTFLNISIHIFFRQFKTIAAFFPSPGCQLIESFGVRGY